MEGGLLSFSPLVRAWVLEIFTFTLKKNRRLRLRHKPRLTEARKSSLTARLLFSSRDSHY